jgi:hypothetical protein
MFIRRPEGFTQTMDINDSVSLYAAVTATLKAFITLLEGAEPDLTALHAAREPLEDFDLYRTALGFLRTALENAHRTSAATERIFEGMRYRRSK